MGRGRCEPTGQGITLPLAEALATFATQNEAAYDLLKRRAERVLRDAAKKGWTRGQLLVDPAMSTLANVSAEIGAQQAGIVQNQFGQQSMFADRATRLVDVDTKMVPQPPDPTKIREGKRPPASVIFPIGPDEPAQPPQIPDQPPLPPIFQPGGPGGLVPPPGKMVPPPREGKVVIMPPGGIDFPDDIEPPFIPPGGDITIESPPVGPVIVTPPPVFFPPAFPPQGDIITEPDEPGLPPGGDITTDPVQPAPQPPRGDIRFDPDEQPGLPPYTLPDSVPPDQDFPDDEEPKLLDPGTRPVPWCNRIDYIADQLAQIGETMLGDKPIETPAGAMDALVTFSIGAQLFASKNSTPKDAWEMIQSINTFIDWRHFRGFINSYARIVRNATDHESKRLPGLLACKALLMSFREAAANFKWGWGRDGTYEYSASPGLFGVGGGWSGKDTSTQGEGTAITINIVLVPAMELVELCIRRECPVQPPAMQEALEAYLQGQITEETARCWTESHGGVWQEWRAMIQARSMRLSSEEVIALGRRTGASEEQIDQALAHRGWQRPMDRSGKRFLYDRLPTIGETIHWFSRNIDDLKYVLDRGLLAGFGDEDHCYQLWSQLVKESGLPSPYSEEEARNLIRHWAEVMAKLGQPPSYWPRFGKNLHANGVNATTALQNYAAHWQTPAPMQLFEMAFRLEPEQVPEDIAFSETDLLRSMTEQDVGPYWLKRMLAIARPAPNLTMLLQAFKVGTIDKPEFVRRLGHLGYSPTDAALLAEAREKQAVRELTRETHGWTPSALSAAYAADLIDEQQVDELMTALFYTEEQARDLKDVAKAKLIAAIRVKALRNHLAAMATEAVSSYSLGILSRERARQILIYSGLDETQSNARLDAADSKSQATVVRKAINALRRAYMGGELSIQEVDSQLQALGITPERRNQYLSAWQIERTGQRETASTAKIVSWAAQGLLPIPTARLRLINLGWRDPDLLLLLAEANLKLAERDAKAQRAAATEGRARARELERIQDEAEAQIREAQAAIRKATPPAKLLKWLKTGIITEDYARSRFRRMGLDEATTNKYLAEVLSNGELPVNGEGETPP